MKSLTWGLALVMLFVSGAVAGDVRVINPKAAFPEGPFWQKGKLYYVEYGGNTVRTWDGAENEVFWKQDGCGPSAVVPAAAGGFLVTCYDSGTIAKISKDGKTIVNYDKDKDGHPFVGPNDFAVDKKGGTYFTASGPWESTPIEGKIFYINPRGVISEVADDLHYANGLVLSADGNTLYCAESEASRVLRFSVGKDGSLSKRRLFVRVGVVDPPSGCTAYPDGLKMDHKGNIYIGQFSSGRIVVVNPKGKLVKAIDVPSPSAPNLNFGATEDIIYIMAVDDVSNAPYWGKVYAVENK